MNSKNLDIKEQKIAEDGGLRHEAGLKLLSVQLENLAGEWARLANYSSQSGYYRRGLTAEHISEMGERLSAASDQAEYLASVASERVLSFSESEEADILRRLSLYAEESFSEIRHTKFFSALFKKEKFPGHKYDESEDEIFMRELSALENGEKL